MRGSPRQHTPRVVGKGETATLAPREGSTALRCAGGSAGSARPQPLLVWLRRRGGRRGQVWRCCVRGHLWGCCSCGARVCSLRAQARRSCRRPGVRGHCERGTRRQASEHDDASPQHSVAGAGSPQTALAPDGGSTTGDGGRQSTKAPQPAAPGSLARLVRCTCASLTARQVVRPGDRVMPRGAAPRHTLLLSPGLKCHDARDPAAAHLPYQSTSSQTQAQLHSSAAAASGGTSGCASTSPKAGACHWHAPEEHVLPLPR